MRAAHMGSCTASSTRAKLAPPIGVAMGSPRQRARPGNDASQGPPPAAFHEQHITSRHMQVQDLLIPLWRARPGHDARPTYLKPPSAGRSSLAAMVTPKEMMLWRGMPIAVACVQACVCARACVCVRVCVCTRACMHALPARADGGRWISVQEEPGGL